jgi:hypothetical protein
MEPDFYRGDLLFLMMDDGPFTVGEVVVFKIQGKEIPIVHRILKIHEKYVDFYFFSYFTHFILFFYCQVHLFFGFFIFYFHINP